MARSRAVRRLLPPFAGLLVAAATLATAGSPAGAQQSAPPKAYIVVDAGSGEVLAAGAQHDALPPASTVKIMTALSAVERLPFDTSIAVSTRAAGAPASADNPIRMQAGEQWRLQDALAVLLLASGNDAAYAIAEAAGGSLEGFAAMMNDTAGRYGMRDSTFNDPAGFSDATAFQGGPRVSAFDLAIATRNALAVPELALLAASPRIDVRTPSGSTRGVDNHNKLLPGLPRAYEGANGFKTGYTDLAGHTLVATAERGGRRLIAVVLSTYDTYGWATVLLDQGFATAPGDGTGETLPDVAVSPYSTRAADLEGFVALARGTVIAAPAAAPGSGAGFATATTAPSGSSDGADAPSGGASAGAGSVVSTRNALGAVGAVLTLLVVLRRRAVKRQRARRLARRRAMAAAMRRGALPVVDGRYRTGTRSGPPIESHVRLHRVERPERAARPAAAKPARTPVRARATNGAAARPRHPSPR